MARVSLIGEADHPELAGTIAKIKGARGGRLINVYRLMLHSPTLADAWFEFNQAVRYGTEIDGQCREIAVIRVAILNNVEYVQRAHGPSYALKEGLTPEQVAAIADWQSSKLFNDKQRALLAYTDAMTRESTCPTACFPKSQTLQRTANRRTDYAHRHLQHVHQSFAGPQNRPGTVSTRSRFKVGNPIEPLNS
jgi:alkylhydroperoxidase family enzyme